jgi:hypothetical protein
VGVRAGGVLKAAVGCSRAAVLKSCGRWLKAAVVLKSCGDLLKSCMR